jgi:hypothetical protein
LPGGGEPEHPAPMLTLGAATGAPHEHHHGGMPTGHGGTSTAGDNIARVLGGAALVVAALGIALVLVRRPRT